MVKLLFFRFQVTNSRLKKKLTLSYQLDRCTFIFSLSNYEREVDKCIYYGLNVREPLEIDTTP